MASLPVNSGSDGKEVGEIVQKGRFAVPFPTGSMQVCSRCGQDLPIDRFSRNGRKDGYRRPECRACQHGRSKEINSNYQMTPGAVAARGRHNLGQKEVQRLKNFKLKEQGKQCVYCLAEISMETADLDHKTPLSRGGSHDLTNLQVLCSACNKEKHSKTDKEYREWRRLLGGSK